MSKRAVAGFPVGEYYQDLWIKGKCIEKGPRECEERYARIAEFCQQYRRPFTVLDWGAQMGYFSIRLTEDFDCTVLAIEKDGNLARILQANEADRVLFINRKMNAADFRKLAKVEHFDLTLALSVVHHNSKTPFDEWIAILRSLGDWLIMELALEPTATGQKTVQESHVPVGAISLGYTNAHFGTLGPRPMFALHTPGKRLEWPFLGCSAQTRGVACAGYSVRSTFEEKKNHKGQDWIRGVNLATLRHFGWCHPSRAAIREHLERRGLPADGHGDIGPHNVIVSGDDAQLIDGYDAHGFPIPDSKQFQKLLRTL